MWPTVRARSRFLPAALPRRLPGNAPRLQLLALAALAAGVALGGLVDASALVGTDGYLFGAGLLLAVGLYGSTSGIDRRELRADLPGVVVAVTLGVGLKAALIAAVMVFSFGRPEYLILGIAVAQIDPLSVAALGADGRMSPRARSLLRAWAAFDDPVTVLLALYAVGWAHAAAGRPGTASLAAGGAHGYVVGLLLNGALLAAVLLLWWAGRRAAERWRPPRPVSVRGHSVELLPAALLVVALLVVAAQGMLMLAVALAGLVVRTPAFERAVGRAVDGAFLTAALALGMLLAHGVRPLEGIVLGAAAFAAQAVVALLVVPRCVRGLDRRDRIALGLGQQNGITAVLIALGLERDFPGTAGIVGPAILTVNLLYAAGQALRTGPARPRGRPRVPVEPDAGQRRPPGYAKKPVAGPANS
ncbi:hypothetical protein GTW43_36075 [Streptomyces sp. SID5785]|uniref:cation:proton antiporter n=1 Tax=Streptomyces sp. SID5785 TaxID=2690309 RepID=UPI00136177B1|nr:cation:proton antiporter [Streptomyces sp. SID5785]MZD10455.1 hypothetical protein [Streptomyces sp. SID5785]